MREISSQSSAVSQILHYAINHHRYLSLQRLRFLFQSAYENKFPPVMLSWQSGKFGSKKYIVATSVQVWNSLKSPNWASDTLGLINVIIETNMNMGTVLRAHTGRNMELYSFFNMNSHRFV